MPIIFNEKCEHDEANSSATYHVEIQDFLAKQRRCGVGVRAKTDSFTVSWSSFHFGIYISGENPGDNQIVITLNNEESWRVKVKLTLANEEHQFWTERPMDVIRPNSFEFAGFIDHDRCNDSDLLDEDGTLRFSLKVEVIDEMVTGGTSKILKKLDAVTERLAEMDARLDSFVKEFKV